MAVPLRDRKEQYFFRETLSVLLLGLSGKFTVIDLRNEASIYGKVAKVTGYMDVELEKCIFRNPRGEFFPFETFFVKSRNIRYVHIPEGHTATDLINEGLEFNTKPERPPGKQKRVFKLKRAQRYQQEILQELKQKK